MPVTDAEEAAAIAALNRARIARQRSPRIEVVEPRAERILAPEQAVSLAKLAWPTSPAGRWKEPKESANPGAKRPEDTSLHHAPPVRSGEPQIVSGPWRATLQAQVTRQTSRIPDGDQT